jgi:RNA polymerase sigma-70 factor, ECF subfamily
VLAAVASHTLRTEERSSRMSDPIDAVPGAGTPSPAEVEATPRRTRPGVPALPPLPESDEELFVLYATTDSDRALWEIMKRYQPKILRYFSRNAATAHRAEDLTQEVFIRIVRNRASYDPNQKFSTWSKTITERIAMNAARTAQRSRVTAFSDLGQPGDADEWDLDPVDGELLPDEAAARSEAREILEDALADVEERYRKPLVLHFLEGLTHTEAARKLGIPVGTAKSRTHHAIEDLREALTRRGYAAAFT